MPKTLHFGVRIVSSIIKVTFSQLTLLKLGLGDEAFLQNDGLINAVSAAAQLEELYIFKDSYNGHEQDHETIAYMIKAARDRQLRVLSLVGFTCTAQDFISILQPFEATLKVFDLGIAAIQRPDCWSEVFQYLLDNFAIEYMSLSHLQADDEDGQIDLQCLEGPRNRLDLSTEEEVREALQRLSSQPKYINFISWDDMN